MREWLRGILAALLIVAGVQAAPVEAPHVSVDLIAEPGWVALKFQVEPEWHLYWRNAGDSGEPPAIKWTLPAGVSAGPVVWPRPERIAFGPLVNYGYEHELVLMAPLTVAPGTAGPIKLAADVTWLVCQEQCVPGKAHLELEADLSAKSASAPIFERTRPKHPTALPAGHTATAARTATGFVLTVKPAPAGEAYFFPFDGNLLDHAAPQASAAQDGALALTLKAQENLKGSPARIAGVLVAGATAWELEAPVSAAVGPAASPSATAPAGMGGGLLGVPMAGLSGAPSPVGPTPASSLQPPASPPTVPPPDAPGGLVEALLLALLGGLVLNVMPCVFPVLSIKALEVVQNAGKEHAHIKRNAVLYAIGVVFAFWVLAGALIGLRAGGERLGWGFHLQSPGFGAVLCGLLFMMSLSLLGVFEVDAPAVEGAPPDESGMLGAFMTGVLATVVATPCTAPFMGTALGWAATQPAAIALGVFTSLGVGLALPYVAISFIPAVGGWLPRPGRWMETVKQGLAFPLLGTVVWLTWVVGLQTDMDTVGLLLAVYLGLAIAGWMHGRWDGKGLRLVAKLLALALFVALGVKVRAPAETAAAPVQVGETVTGEWIPWSPELQAKLLAAGKPVFVDFTAAWCVTCKVNELTALKGLMGDMKGRGVTALKADWTRRDATIAAELAKFGRDGVPLYVLYPGKGGAPRILPQILTRDGVLAELEKVSK